MNATVLPEPVLLPPMTSLPSNIFGMHPFWIPVGLMMAMFASDAMSQGAAPKVAKLRLASTALPLLIAGFSKSPGCGLLGVDFRGLMRDAVGAAGTSIKSSSSGESRRRFLGYGPSRFALPMDSLEEAYGLAPARDGETLCRLGAIIRSKSGDARRNLHLVRYHTTTT